jgi:streptomycin 6-kinase
MLATDLHAGNVLRAQREPWLVIDSKPFVGDRACDAT